MEKKCEGWMVVQTKEIDVEKFSSCGLVSLSRHNIVVLSRGGEVKVSIAPILRCWILIILSA